MTNDFTILVVVVVVIGDGSLQFCVELAVAVALPGLVRKGLVPKSEKPGRSPYNCNFHFHAFRRPVTPH
jgi:hypothetical protein